VACCDYCVKSKYDLLLIAQLPQRKEPDMSDPIQPKPASASTGATPAERLPDGRFAPGNPGGPGRPRGAVSAAAAALDRAAVEVHRELMQVVLEQARAGNLEATKMLWARIWPVRRGRPVAVDVPSIARAEDVSPAKRAVAEAVLSGDITATEAQPILRLIDSQRDQISDDRHCELVAGLRDLLAGEAEQPAR
jgi:hypothetical protein